MQNNSLPLVVEIKRGSHEDGPGIRSVVFFKGCPMRCVFCHSPETQDPKEDIVFSARKCTNCGACVDACPQGAIDSSRPERINREKCIRCGQCAGVCPGNGLRLIGRYYPVEELMEIVLRDQPFYRHSNGGVTFSGGECTLYPKYLESLLKKLKAKQIHLALETCGYFKYDVFRQRILPYVDLIYFDIKIADPDIHQKYTGKTNQKRRDTLFDEMREGSLRVLVVSKVANFSIDLPEVSVAIQVSGQFGSRQEEAQRLGRIVRPKAGGGQAHFYTLVTDDTDEVRFARNRQRFLAEQGYTYSIIDASSLET
jgi:pyruvate formate lyase activating enzyme